MVLQTVDSIPRARWEVAGRNALHELKELEANPRERFDEKRTWPSWFGPLGGRFW